MPIRLCPGRSLPPYSYVPGKFPHPTSDKRGHSFGHVEPPCQMPTNDDWHACEPYLWGFDLFNHGYYWEAHETWEAVWHACRNSNERLTGRPAKLEPNDFRRRLTLRSNFMKGLIKLAAAGVKAREGSQEGVRRHLSRAAELFEGVGRFVKPPAKLLGIQPLGLAQAARSLREKSEDLMNTSSEPVVIVMRLQIQPSNL